jgi:hypothetical protein
MQAVSSSESRPKTGLGSETLLRALNTTRRVSTVRGRSYAAWLRSLAVIVLQQTAELAFAFDVGQRSGGGRRGDGPKVIAFAERQLKRKDMDV